MNEKLLKALNDQMNFEFYSAHIYLAQAGYAADLGLQGFENFFTIQYKEEIMHAMKIFNYINERGGRVKIEGFETPENNFKNIVDAVKTSLSHEKIVSKRINDLMALAYEEKDFASISFLKWFIDEQVEEEDSFNNLITKLDLVKDGSGLYHLDIELSKRTLVTTAE